MTELKSQLESVRLAAFNKGYAAAMFEAGIVREGQFAERNVADIIFDAATRYANGYLVNFDDVTREVQATLAPCLHQIAEPAITAEYAQAAWDAALHNYGREAA